MIQAKEWLYEAIPSMSLALAQPLRYLLRKSRFITARSIAMKFESIVLPSLFTLCLALCVSTLAAMLA